MIAVAPRAHSARDAADQRTTTMVNRGASAGDGARTQRTGFTIPPLEHTWIRLTPPSEPVGAARLKPPKATRQMTNVPKVDHNSALTPDRERHRLAKIREQAGRWDLWGPYLAERQWGTVREDYSPDGDAWDVLPPRPCPLPRLPLGRGRPARHQRRPGPPLLRPRALERPRPDPQGAALRPDRPRGQPRRGRQGGLLLPRRHATHSYLKALYKYPQRAFPYAELVAENRRRGRDQPEYELLDTGVFAEDRYFDVVVEYAKAAPDDILIRITRHQPRSRGGAAPPAADALVPQHLGLGLVRRPAAPDAARVRVLLAADRRQSRDCTSPPRSGHPRPARRLLAGLRGEPDAAVHRERDQRRAALGRAEPDAVRQGRHRRRRRRRPAEAVNPDERRHQGRRPLHRSRSRPAADRDSAAPSLRDTPTSIHAPIRSPMPRQIFATRIAEADAFYAPLAAGLDDEARLIQRQAFAGLIWSKQFYYFDVGHWLDGDPAGPPPPASAQARPQRRLAAPQQRRRHLDARHLGVPLVRRLGPRLPLRPLRPDRSRLRQAAAGPPAARVVHAPQRPAPGLRVGLRRRQPARPRLGRLARLPDRRRRSTARPDRDFLERVFHKLMLNFTWWVNRKDHAGRNVFQGGFLGLDNIGVFDRSRRCRRAATWSRPTAPPGWACSA